MKPFVKYLFAGVLIACNAAAFACSDPEPEDDDDTPCATTRSYDYIGVKGGTNNVHSPAVTSGPANAMGAVIGHRYSDLFSVELEYESLGGYQIPPNAIHATAVSLAAIHTYQFSDSVGLYGRLGLALTHTATAPGFGGNLLYPTASLGFEIDLNKDISMRAAYDLYWLNINGAKVSDNMNGVAFLYKF